MVKSAEESVELVEISVIPKALPTGDWPKSPSVNVVENAPVAMLVLAVAAVIEDQATPTAGAAKYQADPATPVTDTAPQSFKSDRFATTLACSLSTRTGTSWPTTAEHKTNIGSSNKADFRTDRVSNSLMALSRCRFALVK